MSKQQFILNTFLNLAVAPVSPEERRKKPGNYEAINYESSKLDAHTAIEQVHSLNYDVYVYTEYVQISGADIDTRLSVNFLIAEITYQPIRSDFSVRLHVLAT